MAVRVVLNIAAFDELRKSAAVQDDLAERAKRIAEAAGPGMVAEPVVEGKHRARVQVYTDTYEAKLAEAKGSALTRAIDAGRG